MITEFIGVIVSLWRIRTLPLKRSAGGNLACDVTAGQPAPPTLKPLTLSLICTLWPHFCVTGFQCEARTGA